MIGFHGSLVRMGSLLTGPRMKAGLIKVWRSPRCCPSYYGVKLGLNGTDFICGRYPMRVLLQMNSGSRGVLCRRLFALFVGGEMNQCFIS